MELHSLRRTHPHIPTHLILITIPPHLLQSPLIRTIRDARLPSPRGRQHANPRHPVLPSRSIKDLRMQLRRRDRWARI